MSDIDITYLQEWVGRQETKDDDISLFPAQALAAALDNSELPEKGDALPPFWEWMYFLATPQASATGADGHPDKGGFLPPVPLPRRMWAAGEAELHQPLIIGQAATRLSTIESVELKSGSTGTLVFVNVRHDISQNGALCISQVQNIVYREQPAANAALPPAKPAPEDKDFSQLITPNPVLLYRYSALTYNGHRIHYDRNYAVEEELYPALVVHGPLLVTLLLELKRHNITDRAFKSFKFRAVRPTFDTASFTVSGKQDGSALSLWSSDAENALCMTIKAQLAD
jgi:3-methylfumaryl-CoA hydratase